jgi:benzoylformate decarboxylase
MRGRQVFMDSLRLHGVSKIFGNPGTTETPLLDSLLDYPEIDYIMHLHEGVAVSAANFYAQTAGSTAVANMHVAPGLGNAIGAIYGALKNNSPMIVTAGAQDTRIRLRDPLLGHDLVAMAAPVTKWSVQVEHADEMAAIMQRAFKIANTHPAGPVFVALPINVMEQETEIGATQAGPLSTKQRANEDALVELAAMIRKSRHPVIVAGDDVVRDGARETLVALSEKIGAGVHLELVSGLFAFPADHVNFRGRIGADAAAMHQVVGDCDLVLLIGGHFADEVWYSDTTPFAGNSTLVQLDCSAERLANNVSLDLGISGDINDALSRLLEKVGEEVAYEERRAQLADWKQTENAAADEQFEAQKDRSPMTPARALYEVGKAIPADAVIADESITASREVMRNFGLGGTREYYGGRGGGIGQGIAGSIGVAVGCPGQQVIAPTGDGSAMYSIQALWTAAHHQLDILFIMMSNREYRVLKHNVDQYRRRFNAQSNKPYPQMDLTNPVLGFTDMAKGMGIPARQVSNPDEIAAAVAEGVSTSGPFVLDLIVAGLEER